MLNPQSDTHLHNCFVLEVRVDGSSYTVTTTNDSGPGSLREAVSASDSAAFINFAFPPPGQIIQLTSGAMEISTSNIFINGSGVIIDGAGGPYSLFFVDSDSTLTITDATLRNVYSENSPGCIDCFGQLTLNSVTMTGCSGNNGGAINLEINSQLTATNCFFGGNLAGETGGAASSSGPVTLTDCTFEGHTAVINAGGAVWCQETLTATNCLFSGNTVTNGVGGAVWSQRTVILTDCTFTDNSAASNRGGAVHSESTLTASSCSFSNNNAASGQGGALYVAGNTNLVGCTLSSNSAYYGGGAIFVEGASLTSDSMTCSDNSAVRIPLLNNDPISTSKGNTTQHNNNTPHHNATQRPLTEN